MPKQTPEDPLSLAQVLTEEAALFDITLPPPASPTEASHGGLRPLYSALNRNGLAALCLSGGGIRSAAFSLGVLQRLAAEPLADGNRALSAFHYLSTVSGGGYIGAWLSAWLMRAHIDRENGIGQGSADVLRKLADMSANDEAPAIENVRRNSNYLTPKVGAMSADTWADIATYGRNLLLNWLVIAPLIACLVLLIKLLHGGQAAVLTMHDAPGPTIALGIALVLMLVPLSFQTANRPTVRIMNVAQASFLRLDLAVTLVSALVLSTTLGCQAPGVPLCAAIGAVLYLLSWVAAPAWRFWPPGPNAAPWARRRPLDALAWMVAGAIAGALVGLLPDGATAFGSNRHQFIVLAGGPWVVLARICGEIAFVGLTSSWHRSNEDREWFARAGGWYVAALITWLVAGALVTLAPWIVFQLPTVYQTLLALAGGASGLVTLVLGHSSLTTINANKTHRTGAGRAGEWAVTIATPIFACALLIAVSAALDRVLPGAAALPLAIAAGLAALTELVAGLRVDINQFSLHALYRDRLVHCFLAASRHSRPARNLFTDFDPLDDPKLHSLRRAMQPGEAWRPLHVIGAALSIVSTRNLAWQERKEESFTFSALHSGSACIPNNGTGSTIGSYRPTETYARGIRLGTAMAISGAAVSPNTGYHSSPAVSFFLALFDLRLGWWLGNPGPAGARTAGRKGPRFATRPLIDETFGLTNDTHPYVYLSDGGHFDDLGIYEMVRRRCRFIVAVDAGCDPDFLFEDLGNAVRKIWLDHRVEVTFRGLDALRPRSDAPIVAPYHAIGRIHYAAADGPLAEDGVILYLKPSLHRTEPVDIMAYAASSDTFPHEATSDQWFSESQFESYRALGFHEMGDVIDAAHKKSPEAFASLRILMAGL